MRSLSRGLTELKVRAGAMRWTSGAGAVGLMLILLGLTASRVMGAPSVPILWTAGGLSAGTDSAGQAARIATDAWGNVAVVSGPALGRDLAVTSYTATGSFRWRSTVSPSVGTFTGDWVVAAPNGDFARGRPQRRLARQPDCHHPGPVRLRRDPAVADRSRPHATWVARLLVDGQGNAYLAFSSVGDGQDIQLHKYNPSGVLLWSQVISTGSFANDMATSLALSPDETDVVVTGDISGGASWITAAYNATTGARRWLVTAAEGTAARDVVVDGDAGVRDRPGQSVRAPPGLPHRGRLRPGDRGTALAHRQEARGRGQRRRSPDGPGARREPRGRRSGLSRVPRLVHGGVRDHRRGSVGGRSGRRIEHGRNPAGRAGAARWHDRRDRARRSQPSGRVHPGRHGRIRLRTGRLLWEAFSRMATVWAIGAPERRRVRHRRLRRAGHLLACLGRRGQPPADGGHVGDALDRRRAAERDLRRFRIDRPRRHRGVVGMVVRRWRRFGTGRGDHVTCTRRRGRTLRR